MQIDLNWSIPHVIHIEPIWIVLQAEQHQCMHKEKQFSI